MWREGNFGMPIACPTAIQCQNSMYIFKHGMGCKEANS